MEINIEGVKHTNLIKNPNHFNIFYHGIFNQESLLNFISFLESQNIKGIIRKKIFYLIIEMFQNIIRHADNIVSDSDNTPGMFSISENEKEFIITTGNYIHNDSVETLKQKIEGINSLNMEELDHSYNRFLIDFNIEKVDKIGLGILDMRIKSESLLQFHFHRIDENFSYFILQTKVLKN